MKNKKLFEHAVKAVREEDGSFHIDDVKTFLKIDNSKFYYIPRAIYEKMTLAERKEIHDGAYNKIVSNTNMILNSIGVLEDNLRIIIFIKGATEVSELTGLKPGDISMWLNGKRKWSMNKILEVAQKVMGVK